MTGFRLSVAAPLLVFSCGATVSNVLTQLPNTGVNAAQVDPAGNIYVAGYQGTIGTPSSYNAFVSKLSPDGSQVLYTTTFAGSKSDLAVALAIDSSGAAYILGQTQSPDFPVTSGALQSTMSAPNWQGFVAKVNPKGNVVYATFIGGASDISPSAGGLLVDTAGDVFASGESTAGYFVMKLDPTGAQLLATMPGIGGLLASDNSGNIYVAGVQSGPTMIPVTPGAYQSIYQLNACSGTGQLAQPCLYQYIAKVDPNLSQIIYATYLTGSYGASPAGISVDAEGDVWVAGTTNSPDYPVTGQFQPFYLASAPPGPQTSLSVTIYPPPASGYITELDPSGAGLLYSTYFSGSQTDTITFAAFTNSGIYLSGQASSADLPGLQGVPAPCLPQTFASMLAADGLMLTATGTVPGTVLAYDPVTSAFLSWAGGSLLSSDPMTPPAPIACVLDAADLLSVSSIAPGELLSIFGSGFTDGSSAAGSAPFQTTLEGVTVTLNGIASPLLYVSAQQINLQAPFEIANSQQANLNFTASDTGASGSQTLGVVPINPVAFLDTVTSRVSVDVQHCQLNGALYSGGPLPLAFNNDGSPNTCSNPATAGSPVRIFLAGLGVTNPPQVTGSVNPIANVPLNLPITFNPGTVTGTILDAFAAPSDIAGVWAVDLSLPTNDIGATGISLSVNSVPVRDTNLTIWTH
jgi:uncharacterized protein (TIGR03437 family)